MNNPAVFPAREDIMSQDPTTPLGWLGFAVAYSPLIIIGAGIIWAFGDLAYQALQWLF